MDIVKTRQHSPHYPKYWYALAVSAALVVVSRYRRGGFMVVQDSLQLAWMDPDAKNELRAGILRLANLEHALNNKVGFAVVPAGALLGAYYRVFTNWREENSFDIRQPSYE